MSDKTWKVLGSEVVLRPPFLTVSMEQVLLLDGRVSCVSTAVPHAGIGSEVTRHGR